MATKLRALDGEPIDIYSTDNANKGSIQMEGTALKVNGSGTHIVVSQGHNLFFAGSTATIGGLPGTPSIITLGTSGDTVALNASGVTYMLPNITGNVSITGNTILNGTLRVDKAFTLDGTTGINFTEGINGPIGWAIVRNGEELHFIEPEDGNKIQLKIFDDTGIDAIFGYWLNGTRIIDSSRNLLNIGTISSEAISSTGDFSISKNNPWFTLASSTAGANGVEQAAGISIGESGTRGSASLHFTYTGDGYGHIGMGAVGTTTSLPANEAIRLYYTDKVVRFFDTPTVNGNNVWHAGNFNPSDYLTTDKYLNNVSGTCGGTITFSITNGTNVSWDSSHSHSNYLLTTDDKYLSGVSGSGNGTVTFTITKGTNVTWNAAHTHANDHASGSDNQNVFAKVTTQNSSGTQIATYSTLSTADELIIKAGANVTLTQTNDTTNKKTIVTIASTDTKTTWNFKANSDAADTIANTDTLTFTQGTGITITKTSAKNYTISSTAIVTNLPIPKVVTMAAGNTSVTVPHTIGKTSYAVVATASGPQRHVYYTNKLNNSVDICIDDPYEQNIEISVILQEVI